MAGTLSPLDITSNLGSATVATGGLDAPASGTVETFIVTNTVNIPAITASVTQFRFVDAAEASNLAEAEVMTCTAVNGASWTVIRGSEVIGSNGASPVAHQANWVAIAATTWGTISNALHNQSLSVYSASVGASIRVPSPSTAPAFYNANMLTLTQTGASLQLPSPYVGLNTLVGVLQGASGGYSYGFTTTGGNYLPQETSTSASLQYDSYQVRSIDGIHLEVSLLASTTLAPLTSESNTLVPPVDLVLDSPANGSYNHVPWMNLTNTGDNRSGLAVQYYEYDGATQLWFNQANAASGKGFVLEYAPAENILIFGAIYSGGNFIVNNYIDGSNIWHFPSLIACDGEPAVQISGTTSGNFKWQMPFGGTAYKKLLLYFNSYVNSTASNQVYNLTTGGYGSNYIQSFGTIAQVTFNNCGLLVTLSGTTVTIMTPNNATAYSGVVVIEGY